ncbi:hypothetical protein DFJ74DRAFT_707108 [Hyaloraphidium curvatum]|nr:hypothetical protein DFJ74DRAFT_707108 [Hyaloraphidium curvatum]
MAGVESELAPGVTALLRTGDGAGTGPVCLILGWTGGSMKLILKAYGARYVSAGFDVVVVGAPLPPLSPQQAEERFTSVVSGPVWARLFRGRPCVVHSFSNGGLINFTHLLRLTKGSPAPLAEALTVLVVDSAPSVNTFYNNAEFILGTTLPRGGTNPADRTWGKLASAWTWSLTRTVYNEIAVGGYHLASAAGLASETDAPFWVPLRALFSSPDFPNLRSVKFLYSNQDRISSAAGVRQAQDQIAAALKGKGQDTRVSGRLFESSEHVAHAQVYPKEYWNEVAGALAEAGLPEAPLVENAPAARL